MAENTKASGFRIGIGYDIHTLVEGRPLTLGGITIPFGKGLLGHSDGDALLHAIADAMLGAAGLGDIGSHFPDTDPKYRGADSAQLLKLVVELLSKNGWRVVNVDSNIIAERPKMSAHFGEMRGRIASILGVGADRIGVKARTSEGIGAIGRNSAISTHAVVLIEPAG
ncbi:MAG TPA: 2-C-methyl-D-erythritol 2,4-cyclodiphosphate synthase [bacterium]|nr:2-C-methyl-D-erythritol 2,4-cyclodiphosphate synthase [bacterium]